MALCLSNPDGSSHSRQFLALLPNTCLQLTQLAATKELESNRFIRILSAQSLGSCLYEIQPKLTQ
ncbi:hypothetical protein GU254_11030 [Vibrio cholerae]|nr:hypothetical protein [Vibrio paracholerae]PUA70902.1 hypothetical protein DB317_13165 [Vibrio cholerae]MBN7283818.1 hypothetical protein [Vibrio paracholerae]RBM88251.1 hypothetical protein DLR74_10030 [Vibrio paracholerae]TQQ52442.1 hypothetical protein FLL62_11270 [Vibrio cholerae]